jgi:hypothetical protein
MVAVDSAEVVAVDSGVIVLALPDLKTARNRLLGYAGDREGGKLVIAGPKEFAVYLVELDSESGNYLLAHQTDADGAVYECGPGGCSCWGARRWGPTDSCKHFLSLRELGFLV